MSFVPCEYISITIHEIVFKEKKGSDVSAHLFFHAVWVSGGGGAGKAGGSL